MEGLFSVRSDVYSFGILILEIITGQKNSSFHHMEGSLNIVGYVSARTHTNPPCNLTHILVKKKFADRVALRLGILTGVAAVERGQRAGADRPGDPGDVPREGGAAVRAHGAAVRAGPRARPPGHPLRGAHARQRLLRAAHAAPADVHAAVHVVVVGAGHVLQGQGGVLLRQRPHRHHAPRQVGVRIPLPYVLKYSNLELDWIYSSPINLDNHFFRFIKLRYIF